MAREMYLVGVSEEDLKPTPKAEPPKTPREKWENFWYHYKWWFWGGVAAAVVLVVLVVQMLTVNRPDYVMLLVTDEAYLPAVLEQLEQTLADYGQDLDGDGTVEVEVINCYSGNSVDTQTKYTNAQVFQAHLMAGDVMLFAFDSSQLEQFLNTAVEADEFMTPLDMEAAGKERDGLCWNWEGDARITEDPILSTLPEQLHFCVRKAAGTAGDSAEMQQTCLDLLTAFATNQPTAAPAS